MSNRSLPLLTNAYFFSNKISICHRDDKDDYELLFIDKISKHQKTFLFIEFCFYLLSIYYK